MISRRALIAGLGGGGLSAGLLGLSLTAKSRTSTPDGSDVAHVRIDDLAKGEPIDPFIYGSNEVGTMDGGAASVSFDCAAGVTVRRLGGNFLTGYNWRNNATNAGKDWKHENGAFLLGILGVEKKDWDRPAIVIDAFLANSRGAGAASLLTLPLSGQVAADLDGAVAPSEAAPSRRFLPVDWTGQPSAPGVSIPALLAHLVRTYGGARSGGVRGYYLDNEPGLWTDTHPRMVTSPPTIKSLIDRSLRAAKAIKAADPDALVLGPTSWGAPEFADFSKAPDWSDFRSHGTFLAAYLDAFRRESERAGHRLLDRLDVHWYPFNRRGSLFRNENPELAQAALDAPRSLDEAGFCEDSWVADAFGCGPGAGVRLPILPFLRGVIAENFPQTGLSIGEYAYGGGGLLATGLAVADALGRFGRSGVSVANHWGALEGSIGEAYRLYRMKDSQGEFFGATSLPAAGADGFDLSLFAARSDSGALQLIALNKSPRPISFDLALASGRAPALADVLGFDEIHPDCGQREPADDASGGRLRLVAPPLSARRYRLG